MIKPFPHLFLFTAAAAAYALPVDPVAAGTLLFVAGLVAIIGLDYAQRYRGLRLPHRTTTPTLRRKARVAFHAPPLPSEPNRLAA